MINSRRLLSFGVAAVLSTSLVAQFSSGSARSIGMGAASVVFDDIHSLWSNQAGIAHLEESAVSAYAEQHYLLSNLQTLGLGAVYPTRSGNFGITLNYLGFEQYQEQKIGLAYGRKLFDRFSIGAQFLMLNTNVQEYGSKSIFTFEFGLLAELLPRVNIGAHAFSPARINILEEDNVPTIFSMGLAYLPSPSVAINLEVEKDIEYPARFKAGIEYQIIDPLFLRTGLGTNPTTLHFGVGYRIQNNIDVDLATSYHQILGVSPAFGLSYYFND